MNKQVDFIIKTRKLSPREVKKKLRDFIDEISEDCGPEIEEMAEDLKAHGDAFIDELSGQGYNRDGAGYNRDGGYNRGNGGYMRDGGGSGGWQRSGRGWHRDNVRKENEQKLQEMERQLQELRQQMAQDM